MACMIDINVQCLGKKYGREWIFRKVDHSFKAGSCYAITGPNGSGKSTLMQVLCGLMPATEGKINYHQGTEEIPTEDYYRKLSYVAPYMELVEEFTLKELLSFHFSFKKSIGGMGIGQIIKEMYLEKSKNKQVKFFSSGMKQRLKLGLAFYTDTPLLFLDEPTSNMDTKGIDWYTGQVNGLVGTRLVIIASNQPYEYEMCGNFLAMDTL